MVYNTDRLDKEECVAIPMDFYKLHKFVAIILNMMFVNGTALLITLARKIKLVTIEHVPNPMNKYLQDNLNKR